ncbi:protein FAM210A [Nephila pilipes]|uniref:Protein FAM210A n=1 Tax=Nephila pilipes TaxID=299642 RepID=A0A8X6N1C2_NEPPI|nr:protein FAM210A [Nephila pilipes]
MQRLKLSNLCRQAFSCQYSVSGTCVSKNLQLYGKYGLTRVADRTFRTTRLFPYILQPANCYSPITAVVFKRYKHTSSNQDKNEEENVQTVEDPPEKLTLFKRYKKMLKEYWYVLIPVHLVTSAFWFGGFYYSAKSGLDIIPILEYMSLPEVLIEPLRNSSLGHIAVASALYKLATPASGLDIIPILEYMSLPEVLIEPLRNSSLGHIAVASALYKLATPARYMVTLGGTTFSVKFLTKRGLIRPVPTKAEIKTIIQSKLKKDNLDEK